jgi:ribosome assembly protein YihI (activator of Der GTPase)
MCDHINKHDLQIHNKNAKVGAQLITDLLNTTLVKIPNEHIFSPQYEKLTPMELKELGIVESDKVSDEYLENIDKYKTEYFNKLTIYNYPQKVVDRFTQIISDDLCVVIITDKNG